MVEISNLTLIIIIQVIAFLTLLVSVLLFLLRSRRKKMEGMVLASDEDNQEDELSPQASVEYYLTAEIKLAEARFNKLYKKEDLLEPLFSEPDWIELRKNFLQLEKNILEKTEHSDNFWLDLGKKTALILKQGHLVKRLKSKEAKEDDEDETKEMKQLLKSQYNDFDSMFSDLNGAKTEEEIQALKKKLENIIRCHTELSHCIHMLEGENIFLRDQIGSLVSEESSEKKSEEK